MFINTIRNTTIAAIIALAGTLPVTAQEVDKVDQVNQFKVDTWTPNISVIEKILKTSAEKVEWEEFDTNLQIGVQWAYWAACENFFGKDATVCSYEGLGDEFFKTVKDYLLSPMFVKTMLYFDEDGTKMKKFIKTAEIGRVETLLKSNWVTVTTEFNPNYGLNYQSWSSKKCHIRLWGEPHQSAPEGKPSYEECRNDKFVTFLKETYCSKDDSDKCISNAGWIYGFFTRRYLSDGKQAVEDIQKLAQRTATAMDITESEVE